MADEWDAWDKQEAERAVEKPVYTQSFGRSDRSNNSRGGGGGGGGGYRGNKDFDRRDRPNDRDRRSYNRFENNDQRNRNDFDRRPRDNYKRERSDMDTDSSVSGNEGSSRTIQVETRSVGMVIGKGGSKIRQLEADSGAKINIDRNNRGEQTNITLSGSADSVDRANQMIEEIISNANDSRPYNRDNSDRSFNRDNSDRSYNRDSYGRSNRDNFDRDNSDRPQYADSNQYSSNPRNRTRYRTDFEDEPRSNNQNNNSYESKPAAPAADDDDGFVPIDWTAVYAESEKKAAAHLASLPKIIKKSYVEDPAVARMTPEEVEKFRQQSMNISVSRVFATDETNIPIPNPVTTFEQAFHPHPEILETVRKQSFSKPSPIQSQSWPVLMNGEDLIGIAQTGTGKTLAFLLPALIHIEMQTVPREQRDGPTVVILSPTRELACQIESEINKYSYRQIKSICLYGGQSRQNQLKWLKQDKPEIVVATPGRLDDFVCAGEVSLGSVTFVVLDEADKMLDMGFECQIRKILLNIRTDRQTAMTSATWPSGVRRLASQYSNNPIQVVVGSLDLEAVNSVSQTIEIIDEDDKRERLREFLSELDYENDKVIVFCGKKSVTDDIASNLVLQNIECQSLHGDREQCDREQALDDLRTGAVRILIATDVAARGIDIPDITHIFNYDFPKDIEDYVHRVGRTGRAGRTGHSISLFTRRDWANAADLIKILEKGNHGIPEELFSMAERFEAAQKRMDRGGGRRGGGGRGGGGRGGGGFRQRY